MKRYSPDVAGGSSHINIVGKCLSFLSCQVRRDVSIGAGPVGSEADPALLPEPAVPQVAHRAPGRGKRERTEDPVHVQQGEEED